MIPHQTDFHSVVAAACRETRSRAARRLINFLATNIGGALTHEVARACAISNISDTAIRARPALERRGFTIVARPPGKPVFNRFGERTQVHEWKIVPLNRDGAA